ncbi:hypothetical protein MQM1_068 [Aeromonas phage vB_AsaP_MQM1]|nr:hypothetical protein MQM1_068 [Aeromonas phage vB_AsaP_MQM1]
MKVAIKVYEMTDPDGNVLHDVVVNNRYVITFIYLTVEEVVAALNLRGVTGWVTSKIGAPDLFEHKLTNLAWHGDIEVA